MGFRALGGDSELLEELGRASESPEDGFQCSWRGFRAIGEAWRSFRAPGGSLMGFSALGGTWRDLGGASELLEGLGEASSDRALGGLQSYWRSSEGSEPRRSLMGFRDLGGAWRTLRVSCTSPSTTQFMGELEHLPFTIELPTKIKLGIFLLHDVALLHGRTSSMMSELELPSKKNRRAYPTMTIP
jgi:hypothetical protein